MLFKISMKYYITIIFSLFSFVKRYAVRSTQCQNKAVRSTQGQNKAVRSTQGGGGVSPSYMLLFGSLNTLI